jgi:hypothetical protein
MRGFPCPKCDCSSRNHTDKSCNRCGPCDGVTEKMRQAHYKEKRKEEKQRRAEYRRLLGNLEKDARKK